MTRRISTQIYEWIDAALEANPDGKDVGWDGQFGFAADGSPQIAVYFRLPGAVLGTEVRTVAQLVDLSHATKKSVGLVVKQTVESLHEARSVQLTEAPV